MIGVRPRERDNFHSGGLRARALRVRNRRLRKQRQNGPASGFACWLVSYRASCVERGFFCLQQSQPYIAHHKATSTRSGRI